MNIAIKRKVAALLALALGACSLCGCTQETPVTLDSPSPWHDGSNSYERLVYDVTIYNGTGDDREALANGSLAFTLEESAGGAASFGYSTVDMSFSVTYTDKAAESERGLTDTVTSHVEFLTDSLHASKSTKTVAVAKREGVANLSYTIDADYMDKHSATVVMTGGEEPATNTVSIPSGTFYDNEMMFYLARATKLAAGGSNTFKMVNLFDSYNTGKFTNYNMVASAEENIKSIDIGDWVKYYGAEPVTDDETLETTYPIPCYYTSVYINDTRHGPPHYVYYSEKPFVSDGKTHNKVPVFMHYSEYYGSLLSRYTEYKLTSCSFTKPTQD